MLAREKLYFTELVHKHNIAHEDEDTRYRLYEALPDEQAHILYFLSWPEIHQHLKIQGQPLYPELEEQIITSLI